MGKRINYVEGDIIGECMYVGDSGYRYYSSGGRKRLARFKCLKCKEQKEFIVSLSSVKSGNTNSCGCYRKEMARINLTSHGLKNHQLYARWRGIIDRCYYPSCKRYRDYGGRGITICDEWRNDFKAFYDYVTQLPYYSETKLMVKEISLDRRKNDEGYKPGNLRWTNWRIQNINRRLPSNNKTGYKGISLSGRNKPYRATIKDKNKQISIGVYYTIEQAVQARNNYIMSKNLTEYSIHPVP